MMLSEKEQRKSKTNQLIHEKSPYLLQHAYNPVEWNPWGKEAFEKARSEDKIIFLSIGYSTCHWCHVMERESFEDTEVAEALNRDFVSIKVDREERPDIDAVYMTACQIMTGQGGWPLTILMTPDQKPFFAGTYFPKNTVYGRAGLLDVLAAAVKGWKEDRDGLVGAGDRIVSLLNSENTPKTETSEETGLDNLPMIKAKRLFEESYDEQYGGFGRSPKFPSPHNLLFLMRFYEKEKNERSLEMVEKTLRQMYRGGIFDHIGGGFSRYSTDQFWLVPHFEKMLYDNALLSMAYIEAYRITEDPLYKDAATAALDYVIREMTDAEGGFYSAQDADSDGVEGKYYLFRPEEIAGALGDEEASAFCNQFDITKEGNFEGENIPNLLKNREYDKLPVETQDDKNKLYAYRLTRYSLHKDDKILTSWNGMMIAAFARAYREFHDRRYLDAAENANAFILSKLARKDGSLRVRYRDYESLGQGFLDDYAYYVWGLLELFEATHRVRYLQDALDFNRFMIEHFWDDEQGGFYLTARDSEKLISRPKETYDGAIPSGNSVAAYNLVRLNQKMGNRETEEMVKRQLEFMMKESEDNPLGHSFALLALSHYLS